MTWYTDVLAKDPRFGSPEQQRGLDLLFPPFRAKIETLIARLAAMGQTFEVIETYRSQARQERLYAAHATELQKVGVHGYGLACDCCRIVDGKAEWEGALYADYGREAEAVGLVWGGSWRTIVDLVHVQYVTLDQQPALFDGSWYPE